MAGTGPEECVFVVNSANPEVDHLAAEFARRGKLRKLVRRYANMGRLWERTLEKLPTVSRQYSTTMGRRTLPAGMPKDRVTDAGVCCDFLAAAALRAGCGRFGLGATKYFLEMRRRSISRRAAQLVGNARVIVGNYGVSLRAFKSVKASGGCAVLNYPNAHHRFQSAFFAEEAEREPLFARTFTTETVSLAPIFDQECEVADLILVGSTFVRRTFESVGLGVRKIAVVPYGCDTSVFCPNEAAQPNDMFRAVFVGQLSQRKGLSYLLKGYEAFKGIGTELVVAGRYVGDPSVLDPYRHLFTYRGSLSRSGVAGLFQEADVFVFPTLMEGMGLSLLEAMSSGLPVITTDRGTSDLVRDGIDGFIVPIRDPLAIAERLELLRSRPEMRVAMGRAARARALEFTWARYRQQAADAVLQALGNEESPLEIGQAIASLAIGRGRFAL